MHKLYEAWSELEDKRLTQKVSFFAYKDSI